jgi:hypothetical protein
MSNSNTPDRSLLEFQEAVREHFEYIETQYGYKRLSSDPYCVKFNSDTVYLNVYHERISYEIYLEIGILPEDDMNSLKADVLDIVMNSGNASEQTFYQASNKNAVDVVVKKLANLINLYARDALSGSVSYFKSVSNKRGQRQQKALLLEELRVIEEKAKIAWSCKDYSTVVMAYKKYEQHLDAVQLKKLEYARKMLPVNKKQ